MEQHEHREAEPVETPRIYVASLADYNAGRLVGVWIDASLDLEEVEQKVEAMLAAAPTPGAEEYAVFDCDGFGPVQIDEYDPLGDIVRLAAGITTHGPAFAHYAGMVDWHDPDVLAQFEASHVGHFDNLAAYGESVIEDFDYQKAIDGLPAEIIPYIRIDAGAFARDLEFGGLISTSEGDGGIYVFMGAR